MVRPITVSETAPEYRPYSPMPDFNPPLNLIIQVPPALHSEWLAHEEEASLLSQIPIEAPVARQAAYSQACKDRNARLLSGRDAHLKHGIQIHDTFLELGVEARNFDMNYQVRPSDGRTIPIRSYNPSSRPSDAPSTYLPPGHPEPDGQDVVIYYHGGGLRVGDLDSEDLTCRRICKELGCTVYSCDYRLMPQYTADDAYSDAIQAFDGIIRVRRAKRLVVMGSSSGAQLAAMISAKYGRAPRNPRSLGLRSVLPMQHQRDLWVNKIHGVLLRAPITCDSTNGGVNIPPRFRPFHTSMKPEFYTSLLSKPALEASHRTTELLPLEYNDFAKLPRHWIQISTNDIYYSDGVLYAEALREADVEVEIDIIEGFPHTFWLKAPELERAVKAEKDMIEGLRWLFESKADGEDQGKGEGNYVQQQQGGFVPFTEEEFEQKFVDL